MSINSTEQRTVKFKVGKYLYPVIISGGPDDSKWWLSFNYNRDLIDEIKSCFVGCKWHGFDPEPIKAWSISNCFHNLFQIKFLAGEKPYSRYDNDLMIHEFDRKEAYTHQRIQASHILHRRQCILASEMGTGKTLAAIMAMEVAARIGCSDWWWIGPKSALYSVQLEFDIWKANVRPKFYTYDALKKLVERGAPTPKGVVFDESARLKNSTSQRSQAAMYLTECMRREYGDDAYIILMSGAPAPKDPGDWWNQCETACPGFVKEGNIKSFRNRLALIEMRESLSTGGKYPHLVTWKDDENKCDVCGQMPDAPFHDLASGGHTHKSSVNEVALLYRRMSGLVFVQFKKDCLDLPDKRFVKVLCPPDDQTMRLWGLLKAKSVSAIQLLTLSRELSDGFQYREEDIGATETCPTCDGRKTVTTFIDPEDPERMLDEEELCLARAGNLSNVKPVMEACHQCSGLGEVPQTRRVAKEVKCPKEDALKDLIDQHEDVGRIVIYAGFTGSIERCMRIVREMKWNFIKADGKGWKTNVGNIRGGKEMLRMFQDRTSSRANNVAFIGQPGAAGMGLNLTASPNIVFYSNDFNGDSRIQSIERTHRPGMNINRGCTIFDLIHLPTDQYVLDNLDKKIKLQGITLGRMVEELKHVSIRVR